MCWARTPFHITSNECRVAEENTDRWRLVRVWDAAREPRAFEITPPLSDHAMLEPTSFLARLYTE